MRIVLPRGRRRAGLGGLALVAALALPGCGAVDHPPAPPRALLLGVTEGNPFLISPGPVPERFERWRDLLTELRPRYLRLLVVWSQLQPRRDAPPDWSRPADGCLRGMQPCAPFAGIRDELRAARAAGLEVVVDILGAPEWAAARPSGCERPGTPPTAWMPAIRPYRAMVRSLLEEAQAEGVALRWWSAWNEPNHPAFLNPQRGSCDTAAPTLAADGYARLVRALKGELGAFPGDQRIVLGETAALSGPRPTSTGAAEFARALPRDVVCGASVWAQHAYVGVDDDLAGDAPAGAIVRDVEAALSARHCPGAPPHVWITETGVPAGSGPAGCRALAGALRLWAADPRVGAVFQYTFREDTAFRVGLADISLEQLRPAYVAWRAAADGRPDAAPCPA
jgi:hypothetical protein